MTDKERLEFVKNSIDKVKKLWESDEYMKGDEIYISLVSEFDWLIEQAEIVQELVDEIYQHLKDKESLDKQNQRYRERIEELKSNIWELVKQRRNYREALEFYADEENYQEQYDSRTGENLCASVFWDEGYEARKVLKGEKKMTDKERLEDIKKSTWIQVHLTKETTAELPKDDFEWLIEQVKRVSKQETRINNLTFDLAVSRAQNKRYREALINALDELECSMRVGEHELEAMGVISKALEGEE